MSKEILIVKKKPREDRLKVKITEINKDNVFYQKIIPSKDFNFLAELFFDLHRLGYNIEKAFAKYREFLNEPELFFLR